MRILLVEDSSALRLGLTQGLTNSGFVVDVAADGQQGWIHASCQITNGRTNCSEQLDFSRFGALASWPICCSSQRMYWRWVWRLLLFSVGCSLWCSAKRLRNVFHIARL